MKSIFLHSILVFLLLNICLDTNAQNISYRNLTTKNGLPSNTIYQVKQDKRGFIWMATANGLIRYDGTNFQTFNPPKIKDKEILGLYLDQADNVWFWNLKGKLFFTDNKIIKQSRAIPAGYKIVDFKQDSNGNYWYSARDKGTFRINKEGENQLILNNKYLLNLLTVDDEIYARNNAYICRFNPNLTKPTCFRVFEKNFVFKEQPTTFRLLFKYLNNQFWCLSTRSWRLYKVDRQGDLTSMGFPNFRQEFEQGVNDIFLDNNRNYWVLTDEKILVFDTTETKKITEFTVPYVNNVSGFLHDNEGNYWLSTLNHGVLIIPNLSFNTHKIKEHEENIAVSSLSNIDDKLYVGLANGQLIIRNTETQKENHLDFGINASIKTFIKGKDKTVWFFTPVKGYIIDQNNKITKLNKNQVNINYKSFYIDDQDILIGNYSGVVKIPLNKAIDYLQNYNWFSIQSKFSIKGISERTYAIEKVKNEFWLGSSDGLYYVKNNKATLTKIPELKQSWITNIINQNDTIWIGTQTDGLFQVINKKITRIFNEENGLCSNNCKSIVIEPNGIIWVGTNNGINKINIKTEEIDLINNLDGLLGNDINALAINNNNVFVGTSDGLTTFDNNISTKNLVAPPIHLTRFQIYEKDTILSDAYTLRYDQNNIHIHFTGISFRSQGTFKYKYRMKNISDTWTVAKSNIASFPVLNPGEYIFEAYAINEDGIESEVPIRINIIIKTPFWQTWWFFILTITLIFSSFILASWLRLQRIKEKLMMKNDFQQKINELEMKALQAQMNPHFIFNALNAIQHYLTIGNDEQAMIYLARFAKLIRMIFEFSKKTTISLTDEIEFLQLYLGLEKLRFKDKIIIDFEIDDEIYTDNIKIPPLLIQPILENAFKHGLLHRKKGGELDIQFLRIDNAIYCTVQDNGIGRAKVKTLKSWKNKNHNSSGLATTTERLNLWLSKSTISDDLRPFEIIDLEDKDGVGCGTLVKMLLKIEDDYND